MADLVAVATLIAAGIAAGVAIVQAVVGYRATIRSARTQTDSALVAGLLSMTQAGSQESRRAAIETLRRLSEKNILTRAQTITVATLFESDLARPLRALGDRPDAELMLGNPAGGPLPGRIGAPGLSQDDTELIRLTRQEIESARLVQTFNDLAGLPTADGIRRIASHSY